MFRKRDRKLNYVLRSTIAKSLVFVTKNFIKNIIVTNGECLIDFMLNLLLWLTRIVLAKIFHYLKIIITMLNIVWYVSTKCNALWY